VIQHLRVLKNAGLLNWNLGQDARFLFYYLRPEWRPNTTCWTSVL